MQLSSVLGGGEAGGGAGEEPETWALGVPLLQLYAYDSQPHLSAR